MSLDVSEVVGMRTVFASRSVASRAARTAAAIAASLNGFGTISNAPIFWSLFGAGGMLSALIGPALVFITGIAVPSGLLPGLMSYQHTLAFARNGAGKLFLFLVVSLFLWHGAHRIFHSLHDLGLHTGTLAKLLCYGLAFASLAWAILLPWWSFPTETLRISVELPHGLFTVPVGALDITFYRDDVTLRRTEQPVVHSSHLDFAVEEHTIDGVRIVWREQRCEDRDEHEYAETAEARLRRPRSTGRSPVIESRRGRPHWQPPCSSRWARPATTPSARPSTRWRSSSACRTRADRRSRSTPTAAACSGRSAAILVVKRVSGGRPWQDRIFDPY